MDSVASVTGDEITYAPLAHLPRSMMRQRSLQKGKSASVLFTAFLQMGQRSLRVRLRGIQSLIVEERLGMCNGLLRTLYDLGYQIVIVCLGDLAAVEVAGLRGDFVGEVVDENFAVDLGRVHEGAAFQQQFRFF